MSQRPLASLPGDLARRLRNRLRARGRFTFLVERLLLRGAQYRLLFIAALIGIVSLVGGALVLAVDGAFGGPGEAIWWAFLRLTDPGYLGDDVGLGRRVIATAVTVVGYVLFMGALIAIMTQWLTHTMRNLERGLTPVSLSGHILVLGWSNRTPTIVQELVRSEERVQRFLRRRGTRRLRIAILAEEVAPELVQELADALGADWNPNQVIFRSGSALHIDHLARVDFARAGAVIVPGADFSPVGAVEQDATIVKVLLSISRYGTLAADSGLPLVVTDIFDPRKLHVARRAYGGLVEIVLSSQFFSRLVTQTLRHPGMTALFNEVLANGHGAELYVRSCPAFAGRPFEELFTAFPDGVLLGVVRPSGDSFTPILNPDPGFRAGAEDRFVVLAHSFSASAPGTPGAVVDRRASPAPAAAEAPPPCRVLTLGWNRRVPALLEELESHVEERFEVDIVSNVPVEERERLLAHFETRLSRTTCRQILGDYTSVPQLARLQPETYDRVLLLASEWMQTDEEADARTVLAERLLRERLVGPGGPHVLVELMDEENLALLADGRAEHLVSPRVVSHILAQIALRRELRAVYDEVFGPGGAEFLIRPAADLGLGDGRSTFAQLQRLAHERGEIALGVHCAGSLRLNPGGEFACQLADGDGVIVLATYGESSGAAQPSGLRAVAGGPV